MKGKKFGKTSFFPPMHMHIQIYKFNNLDIIDCVNWIIISCGPSTSFQVPTHASSELRCPACVSSMQNVLLNWVDMEKVISCFPLYFSVGELKRESKTQRKRCSTLYFFFKRERDVVLWFIILILVYWLGRLSILSMLYIKR